MKRFGGRVAVVTGAASGIGRALSVALAGRGVDVAAVDLDAAGLASTADEVERLGRRVSTHVVDVASAEQMQTLAEAVVQQHQHVDILVNNAGVSVAAEFEQHRLEDFQWLIGVNLWGVVHGCKFFLPALRNCDEAYIVNLSSVFGLVGVPGQTSYCASKFAVRGFSEALGAELAGSSVRVMSVHPGGISTNIAANTRWSELRPAAERQRVLDYFEKRAMPASKAADRIVAAMEAGRTRLLIAPETYVTDAIKRLFPTLPPGFLKRARATLSKLGVG